MDGEGLLIARESNGWMTMGDPRVSFFHLDTPIFRIYRPGSRTHVLLFERIPSLFLGPVVT